MCTSPTKRVNLTSREIGKTIIYKGTRGCEIHLCANSGGYIVYDGHNFTRKVLLKDAIVMVEKRMEKQLVLPVAFSSLLKKEESFHIPSAEEILTKWENDKETMAQFWEKNIGGYKRTISKNESVTLVNNTATFKNNDSAVNEYISSYHSSAQGSHLNTLKSIAQYMIIEGIGFRAAAKKALETDYKKAERLGREVLK